MKNLIVVESVDEWPRQAGDFEVVSDIDYFIEEHFQDTKNYRVFNLCRSYRYQTSGYYVSLLAAARGQKPIPSLSTIQEMKTKAFVKITSDNLDALVQKSLADIKSDTFELSIYFGKNIARKYDKLAAELYKYFASPLIRAKFTKKNKWLLSSIGPISLKDVPRSHKVDLIYFAESYFKNSTIRKPLKAARYSLAILRNPTEALPPSDDKAIQRFIKAAQNQQIEVDIIGPDDLKRLAEYDALFIRETTNVNHHTFRFAQKAKALGLVVIDDPESILRCTNKVFLAELLKRHHIPTPKSFIIHKKNLEAMLEKLPVPCVLKQPDSAFSQGVLKAKTREEIIEKVEIMLKESDLVIAQEFMPTPFDWRIGVIDNKPLYACKYFMARGHWQIYNKKDDELDYGHAETFPLEEMNPKLITLALKTAAAVGDGLYGLDIKEKDGKYYVIEVNDNPSIDAGVEDKVIKHRLYDEIISVFVKRLEAKSKGHSE
ncbi:MAG: RimK family protein [Oligoflexus sp.]|nr:RimK family protein [Oligoflexus sp.]